MANKMSTEKMLQNQRIAIWLILAFVVFITLWFVYSVKTLQTTSMTTSSEARYASTIGTACTRSDNVRYSKKPKSAFNRNSYGSFQYCCRKPGTAQYVWGTTSCSQ